MGFEHHDPNSENQTWSHWRFAVQELRGSMPYELVKDNARRWLRAGFGSVGRMKVKSLKSGWLIEAQIEGADVQDQEYVDDVGRQFQQNFVEAGWGAGNATSLVTVKLLAGDPQDGQPRTQLIVLPTINLTSDFMVG